MDVFSSPAFDDHEQVVFFYDRPSGLKAIVALHDTTLGPAVGGCRFWPYASEVEALTDVLRLSKGMTYKAAMADLPFGGGKTVIIGDPRSVRSEALFRALGRGDPQLGRGVLYRRGRRHQPAGYGLGGSGDALRAGALARRQRRPVAGHRAGRSARHQGSGQAPLRSRRAAGRARRHPGDGACRRQPRDAPGGGRARS